MSVFKIRPAVLDDYGAIAAIYNEAIARGGITMDTLPHTADHIQGLARKMNAREMILVGVLTEVSVQPQPVERVIGWGIVQRYSDRRGYQVCCETSVYLYGLETGKRYGRLIQSAIMKQAIGYDYRHIVAKMLAVNQGSIRFHQRFGFKIVGVQKKIGLINDTWHDVVIMQCLISHA